MKRPGLAFLIVLLSILVAAVAADAQQAGRIYRIGVPRRLFRLTIRPF
jgi:hypothetical protein